MEKNEVQEFKKEFKLKGLKYNQMNKSIMFVVCLIFLAITITFGALVATAFKYDMYFSTKKDATEEINRDVVCRDFYCDSIYDMMNAYSVEDYSNLEILSSSHNENLRFTIGTPTDLFQSDEFDLTKYTLVYEASGYYYNYAIENTQLHEGKVYINNDYLTSSRFDIVNLGIDYLYKYKHMLIIGVIVLLCFDLWIYIWLLHAAGRRENREGYVMNACSKIPLEIYFPLICFAIFFLAAISSDILFFNYRLQVIFTIIVFVIGGMLVSIDFAIRVKTKTLFSNTLIAIMYRKTVYPIKLIVKKMWKEHTNLMNKLVIVYVLIGFFAVMPFIGAIVYLLLFAPLVYLAYILMKLHEATIQLAEGNLDYQVDTAKMIYEFKESGENLNSIAHGMNIAVEERLKSERFKTELITNVSHDIKTPLTSIINYADLINKEETENENIKEYSNILLHHSERLRKMSEDLIEVSKATTGNLEVNLQPCQIDVLLSQIYGEYDSKMQEKGLDFIINKKEYLPQILADSKYIWRVLDNMMNNIYKYALENTRVYIDVVHVDGKVSMIFKNISKYPLNVDPQDLLARFVRGDDSRHTSGSGLGLSIANGLVTMQKGSLDIQIDGDLFKIVLLFDAIDKDDYTEFSM